MTRASNNVRCACSACGSVFCSVTAFDLHRVGTYAQGREKHTRRCLSVDEMLKRGMAHTASGAWSTGRTFSREAA